MSIFEQIIDGQTVAKDVYQRKNNMTAKTFSNFEEFSNFIDTLPGTRLFRCVMNNGCEFQSAKTINRNHTLEMIKTTVGLATDTPGYDFSDISVLIFKKSWQVIFWDPQFEEFHIFKVIGESND